MPRTKTKLSFFRPAVNHSAGWQAGHPPSSRLYPPVTNKNDRRKNIWWNAETPPSTRSSSVQEISANYATSKCVSTQVLGSGSAPRSVQFQFSFFAAGSRRKDGHQLAGQLAPPEFISFRFFQFQFQFAARWNGHVVVLVLILIPIPISPLPLPHPSSSLSPWKKSSNRGRFLWPLSQKRFCTEAKNGQPKLYNQFIY